MSSLRLDSLRLCWLETFVMVVDQENISAAARLLDISQPMASRNMQALEKWLGKKLIEPGKINDPQNPRISIGVTDDGRAFYDVSISILEKLKDARSEAAARQWMIDDCRKMLKSMNAGIGKLRNPDKWPDFIAIVELMSQYHQHISDDTHIDLIRTVHKTTRGQFKTYEKEVKRDTKTLKKATKLTGVPDDWFDTQRARRQQT